MFNLKDFLPHFESLAKKYLGSPNMVELESLMRPLRNGEEEFSLKHIKIIKDEEGKNWKFLWFWKIPEIDERTLSGLRDAFKRLKPIDRAVIGKLKEAVGDIEVVSCILRFADPDNYAILSPPVENLLNIKGKDHVEKYLNYLHDLKLLKDEYEFDRMADVDKALWTLARILNSNTLRYQPPYDELYDSYKSSPNLVKKIMASNSLKTIFEDEPILVAELLLEREHVVSAMIAGRLLELKVKKLCEANTIKLQKKTKKGPTNKKMYELLEDLRFKRIISETERSELKTCWDIRCRCTHEDDDEGRTSILPSRGDVEKMVKKIRDFLDDYE